MGPGDGIIKPNTDINHINMSIVPINLRSLPLTMTQKSFLRHVHKAMYRPSELQVDGPAIIGPRAPTIYRDSESLYSIRDLENCVHKVTPESFG